MAADWTYPAPTIPGPNDTKLDCMILDYLRLGSACNRDYGSALRQVFEWEMLMGRLPNYLGSGAKQSDLLDRNAPRLLTDDELVRGAKLWLERERCRDYDDSVRDGHQFNRRGVERFVRVRRRVRWSWLWFGAFVLTALALAWSVT